MANEEISFKLGLDAKAFQRGLTSVRSQVASFGSDMKTKLLGAFAVGAIVERIASVGKQMEELRRNAEDQGVSTTFLQSLERMAVKFGASSEDAGAALTKLNVKIGDARDPSSAAAKSFDLFGIALNDATGMARTSEDVFKSLADKYATLPDASAKASFAMEFFGRTGLKINNILAEGSVGIEAYAKSMEALGQIQSERKVDALADAWLAVKGGVAAVGGVVSSVMGVMASSFGVVVKFFGAVFGGARSVKDIMAAIRGGKVAPSKTDPKDSPEYKRAEESSLLKLAEAAKKYRDELDKLTVSKRDAWKSFVAAGESVQVAAMVVAETKQSLRVENTPEGPARVAEQKKLDDMISEREAKEERFSATRIGVLESEEQELIRQYNTATDTLEIKRLQVEMDKKGAEILKEKADLLKQEGANLAAKAQRERVALDLAKQRVKAEKEARGAESKAVANLAAAKSERFKFSLQELAEANPRNFRGAARQDILGAQQVQRLEAQAQWQNLFGTEKERDRLQSMADQRRQQIGLLRADERFPFKALEEAQRDSAKSLRELNAAAQGAGIPVIPKLGT